MIMFLIMKVQSVHMTPSFHDHGTGRDVARRACLSLPIR